MDISSTLCYTTASNNCYSIGVENLHQIVTRRSLGDVTAVTFEVSLIINLKEFVKVADNLEEYYVILMKKHIDLCYLQLESRQIALAVRTTSTSASTTFLNLSCN